MKVLATFVGGWGHAEPVVPVAEHARRLGHQVTFAGQSAVLPQIEALGFPTREAGPDTLSQQRRPLAPVDPLAERAVIRDVFVTRFGGARLETVSGLLAELDIDIVLCDDVDVGAVLAAESAGIPCVTVSVLAAGRMLKAANVGEAWSALRESVGLTADPGCSTMGGTLTLAAAPSSFRDAEMRDRVRFVRPEILDRVTSRPRRDRPFVYATLGTVFNVESGDLFERIVAAASQLAADVLITTGGHIAGGEFGDVPPHVRIEPFVPIHEVLGGCAATLSHGGSGTLVASRSRGVPAVVIPMGADHIDNAHRVEQLGVGLQLDAHTADAATIAAAVREATANPRYATAAAKLATEAAAQPRLADVAELAGVLSVCRGSGDKPGVHPPR